MAKTVFDKVSELQVKAERNSAQILQLPLWPETRRGAPNDLLRSALFCVRNQRLSRRYFKDEPIVVLGDCEISYRGEELRQDDLDVWLQLMHLQRGQVLGQWIEFTAHSLLKAMGWRTSKRDYEHLRRCLSRMQATAVAIHSKRLSAGLSVSLIEEFAWRDHHGSSLGQWRVLINPKMHKLFGDVLYTQLEWSQRKQLGTLARGLHGLYASHAKPYPMKVETILSVTGSTTKDLAKFRQLLRRALNELVEVGFLESWTIDKDLVHVSRL